MLLRTGLVAMMFSVLLAAGVALMVGFRSEAPEAQGTLAEPLAAETETGQKNEFNPGKKLEIDEPEEPKPRSEPAPSAAPSAAPSGESLPQERPTPRQGSPERLPISNDDWPVPTNEELAWVSQPRYYTPTSNADMTLTIEALGLYDVPVYSSFGEEVLDWGIMHVPDTAYPWDGGNQKNVFLAAHNFGWPGTQSRLLFYNLDALRNGDSIILWDRAGRGYQYSVSDLFTVQPEDAWVADTIQGRDLLTLQTCTPYPTFEKRLVVRADRI